MRKSKIILTGPSLEAVSGVSTHLRLLLGSNLKERFDFVHFQVGSQGRSENRFQRVFRLISSLPRLAVSIWKNKPILVHLNPSMDPKSFWRDSLYLLVVKLMRCKIVYQLHGGQMPQAFCRNPIYKAILPRVLKCADAIVLLGDFAVRAYDEFCPGLPLTKIPNAIDLKIFEAAAPKQMEKNHFTIGYIGRISETKGIIETLEAISLLKSEDLYGKLIYKIAGSGPDEDLIRDRICTLGIEDKVVFMGPVFGREKIDFWKRVDLFVFPTYHKEGLPYSILESLASGTPVITTREGGIREIIAEGRHGLFVDPKQPAMIAEMMKRFYQEDISIYTSMSRACIDLAKNKYGIEMMESEFLRLYSRFSVLRPSGEMELAKH